MAKDFPGGNADDEGNLYDLYTSWGAGPIVYGLQRLLPHVAPAAPGIPAAPLKNNR